MPFSRVLRWLKCTIATITVQALVVLLAAGPIPKHMAFIMDGNRRYARSVGKRPEEGHTAGFQNLLKVVSFCARLGVKSVSAYAFSIENFKRSSEEVDPLLKLSDKFVELCQPGCFFSSGNIRVNIVGRTALLPESVQRAAQRVELLTRDNDGIMLNLCVAYTSCDEMTTAVQSCVSHAIDRGLDAKPWVVTEEHIDSQLLTARVGSSPLDILVRTGNAKRLSNFFMWQCCEDTQLHFLECYWPRFSLRDLIPIIVDYQIKAWKS
ncbi:putative adds multiple copies of isopentenyl pyrophosphate (IPP) to farnesyl pyrophosphate (FPP) to produce dehydrodolichyl diphosphate (Dedol-PP), a precursor of dolichol which is utilized as a sugar carrier in protein glycosylation in the endoplasmic reticulum (ER) [Lyophyllum shimeji]|uniref:Alkyl transferase n=1 Tax=Lyophyllum shimeji TaxID=47721 RepID=A0A9P3PW08_LYOSH|nr:putative adds multiple copies of isopentenyl pyrophosphate (IPP) to farnesyl pyrophosphate (FPP) to produce dehydrodolichyl diphosphate (Dedol-PP), a precursor of dolichol which is utilized as a sugar carrier in protein glycosylation in the endoplasmic reticulum (ER) [Lyophyllum shimeji]